MNKETRLILRGIQGTMQMIRKYGEPFPEVYDEIQEALNPKQEDKSYKASL